MEIRKYGYSYRFEFRPRGQRKGFFICTSSAVMSNSVKLPLTLALFFCLHYFFSDPDSISPKKNLRPSVKQSQLLQAHVKST